MLGAIFGQAPLALLVEALGWRTALGVLAAVGSAIALSLYATVPDVAPKPGPTQKRLTQGLRIAARNRQTWLNAAFGLSMTGTMLAFAGLWAVPWLVSVHGFERAGAAAMSSSMFVGWAVGSPLIGWLSDRAGRRKPFQVGCGLGMTATLLAILYGPHLAAPALALLMFVNGVFASGMILAYVAARAHNPPEASGATYGIVNTGVVGSGAVFQPLIGLVLDLRWDGAMRAGARIYTGDAYDAAFAVLPLVAMAGTIAAALTRERPPS
jgi:predicted MFS family arabinose efflux permease